MIKLYRRHRWLGWVIRGLAVAGSIGFLGRSLLTNWQDFTAYEWRIDRVQGALAVSSLVMAFALLPLSAREALSGLGHPVSYGTSYRGYFVGQLTKYLPGGIWVVPARAMSQRRAGVDAISSIAGMVTEMLLLLVSGITVFLPYSLALRFQYDLPIHLLSLLLFLLIVPALHPRFLNRALRWLINLVGQESEIIELSTPRVVRLMLIDVAFWLTAGTGLFLLVSSVHTVPWRLWPIFPSALGASWASGFVAFVMPAGLGVREGVLAWLLAPFLPPPLPLGIALLARLWWMVSELVSIGLALIMTKGPAEPSTSRDP